MITYDFKSILAKFHQDQKAAALTEFVILLPVWVTMFVGVVSLGKIGMETTTVPISAQHELWTNALKATAADLTDEAAAMSPVSGGAQAGAVATGLSRGIPDAAEALIDVTLAAKGHWGESYDHVVILNQIADVDDLTMSSDDILSEAESGYPKNVVDDGIGSVSFDNIDSAFGIIASLLSGSGLVASTAAGIRYGMATGKKERTIQPIRGTSFTAKSHFDVLLAPHPTKKKWSIGMARLLAEGEDNYSVMMNFGESEWDSGSGGGGGGGGSVYNNNGLPGIPDISGGDKPSDHQQQIDDHYNEVNGGG